MSVITIPDITFLRTMRQLIIIHFVLSDGLPFTSLLGHAQHATEIPLSAQMFVCVMSPRPFGVFQAAKTFKDI